MMYVDDDISKVLIPITCNDATSSIEKLSSHTKERVAYRMSLALEGIISEYISRN